MRATIRDYPLLGVSASEGGCGRPMRDLGRTRKGIQAFAALLRVAEVAMSVSRGEIRQ
jgi:hypothetical protein